VRIAWSATGQHIRGSRDDDRRAITGNRNALSWYVGSMARSRQLGHEWPVLVIELSLVAAT
jgi:hypothetical protein